MDAWGVGARRQVETQDCAGDARRSTVTRVGRLVEVTIGRLATSDDVLSMSRHILAALERAGKDGIVCADHRRGSLLSREVADVWATRMRGGNGMRARSVLLVDPSNTTYNLQIARVVQCALSPTRRMFTDAAELLTWLDGVVTDAEHRELRAFFS